MRNKRGLSARQSKFINTLIEGQLTTSEIERAMRLRSSTLQRWMNEAAFKLQWKYANELLELRRKSDEEALRIRAAKQGHILPVQSAPPSQNPRPSQIETPTSIVAVELTQPSPCAKQTSEDQPPLTERQRLVARFGESAGQSFDRLLLLRQQYEAAHAKPSNANNGEDHDAEQNDCDISPGPDAPSPREGERLSPAGAVSLPLEEPSHVGGGVGCSA